MEQLLQEIQELIEQGYNPLDIANSLLEQGYSEEEAYEIFENLNIDLNEFQNTSQNVPQEYQYADLFPSFDDGGVIDPRALFQTNYEKSNFGPSLINFADSILDLKKAQFGDEYKNWALQDPVRRISDWNRELKDDVEEEPILEQFNTVNQFSNPKITDEMLNRYNMSGPMPYDKSNNLALPNWWDNVEEEPIPEEFNVAYQYNQVYNPEITDEMLNQELKSKQNNFLNTYANISDALVKGSRLLNQTFIDANNKKEREKLRSYSADRNFAYYENPKNKRGNWDINTGLINYQTGGTTVYNNAINNTLEKNSTLNNVFQDYNKQITDGEINRSYNDENQNRHFSYFSSPDYSEINVNNVFSKPDMFMQNYLNNKIDSMTKMEYGGKTNDSNVFDLDLKTISELIKAGAKIKIL